MFPVHCASALFAQLIIDFYFNCFLFTLQYFCRVFYYISKSHSYVFSSPKLLANLLNLYVSFRKHNKIAMTLAGLCTKRKVPETVPHFGFVCPRYSSGHNILKRVVKRLGLNFDVKYILSNKVVYLCLIRYMCSSNRLI